jgi:hypothetical protein
MGVWGGASTASRSIKRGGGKEEERKYVMRQGSLSMKYILIVPEEKQES